VNEQNRVLLIIVVCLIFVSAPSAIRLIDGNSSLIGDKPYFNMKVAESIEKGENLAFPPDPYQYLLSVFENKELLSIVLPIFFGLTSLLLIALILKKISDSITRTTTLFILALSPVFIYTFSVSSKYSFVLTLMLAGFLMFTNKGWKNLLASAALFTPLILFGNKEVFTILFLLFLFTLTKKENKKRFAFLFGYLFILSAMYNLYIHNNFPMSVHTDFVQTGLFTNVISDFGAHIGIGFFMFILAFIGSYSLWKNKRENYLMLGLFLFTIIAFFVREDFIIYAGMILSWYSGIGLAYIYKRKWEMDILKYLTIITLVSGLLFSAVSYVNVISHSQPTTEQIESFEWMKSELPEGVVFSHYSKGFFIEQTTGLPVYMNGFFKHKPDINEKYEISEEIFYSRNQKKTKSLLQGIDYIWIDKDMKNGLVWNEKEEGLLFLLKDNETFKKIYNTHKITIYGVRLN